MTTDHYTALIVINGIAAIISLIILGTHGDNILSLLRHIANNRHTQKMINLQIDTDKVKMANKWLDTELK